LGIALKPIQEILGFGLLDSAPMTGYGERWGLGSQPSLYELMIGVSEGLDHLARQTALSPGTSLFYSEMAGKEMSFEVASPVLFLLFFEKAQLAKRMGVALGMLTLGILRIATVPVVLHDPMKLRQDAYGISGGLTSLAMDGVMGELVGPCHMQPMQHPLDSNPSLIGSHHFGCS
jgi:hypothetical protein